MKTLGKKDVAEALNKTESWVKSKLWKLSETDMDDLGIYKNSSGYQVPPEALNKPPFTVQPGSRWGKGGASER